MRTLHYRLRAVLQSANLVSELPREDNPVEMVAQHDNPLVAGASNRDHPEQFSRPVAGSGHGVFLRPIPADIAAGRPVPIAPATVKR